MKIMKVEVDPKVLGGSLFVGWLVGWYFGKKAGAAHPAGRVGTLAHGKGPTGQAFRDALHGTPADDARFAQAFFRLFTLNEAQQIFGLPPFSVGGNNHIGCSYWMGLTQEAKTRLASVQGTPRIFLPPFSQPRYANDDGVFHPMTMMPYWLMPQVTVPQIDGYCLTQANRDTLTPGSARGIRR